MEFSVQDVRVIAPETPTSAIPPRPTAWGGLAWRAAVLLAAVILGWWVLGVGVLVLSGAWLIAAGLSGWSDALRGPAGWAGGVLGSVGLVLAGSVALAAISPQAHSGAVALVLLCAPNAVGALLLALGARWGRRRVPGESSELLSVGVPLVVAVVALVVALAVAASGANNGIAWAMSGDARNHVAIMRGILADGGLTVSELTSYPAAINALMAVLAAAGGRAGSAGQVMVSDVQAMASTYLLAAIGTATLTAGALVEFVPRRLRGDGRTAWLTAPVVLVAAALAGSPLVLGVALSDGFLSAYGALPLALASVVICLRLFGRSQTDTVLLLLLMVAAPLTFIAWTVLAVVPITLLGLGALWSAVQRHPRVRRDDGRARPRGSSRFAWIVIGAGLVEVLGLVGVVYLYRAKLVAQFILTGSSKATHAFFIPMLVLVAVALVVAASRRSVRQRALVPVAVGLAGIVTVVWLRGLPEGDPVWTYYALKTNWLVTACLLWVAFVPIVLWIGRITDRETGVTRERAPWRVGVAATCASVAILVPLGSAATAGDPLLAAARGWYQPTGDAVGVAVEAADSDDPYVLWEWSDPGNDRLANFWAALAWGSDDAGEYLELPGVPGGIRLWAYFAGMDVSELCTLAAGAPGLDVYTHNAELESEVRSACPSSGMEIIEGDSAAEG